MLLFQQSDRMDIRPLGLSSDSPIEIRADSELILCKGSFNCLFSMPVSNFPCFFFFVLAIITPMWDCIVHFGLLFCKNVSFLTTGFCYLRLAGRCLHCLGVWCARLSDNTCFSAACVCISEMCQCLCVFGSMCHIQVTVWQTYESTDLHYWIWASVSCGVMEEQCSVICNHYETLKFRTDIFLNVPHRYTGWIFHAAMENREHKLGFSAGKV